MNSRIWNRRIKDKPIFFKPKKKLQYLRDKLYATKICAVYCILVTLWCEAQVTTELVLLFLPLIPLFNRSINSLNVKDKKTTLRKNFYVVGSIKCMISNHYFKAKLMILANSHYWDNKRERDIRIHYQNNFMCRPFPCLLRHKQITKLICWTILA